MQTYSAVFKSKPSVVRSLPSASMLRSGSVIRITPNKPNKPYGSDASSSLSSIKGIAVAFRKPDACCVKVKSFLPCA